MSKTEEYLDSLLNNVSPERKAEADRKKRRTSADFIKEFENELDDTDIDDVIKEFDSEMTASSGSGKTEDNFFGNLEGIVNSAKEASLASQEKKPKEDSFEVNTLADDSWIDQPKESGDTKEKPESLSKEAEELSEILSEVPTSKELSEIAGASRIMQEDDDQESTGTDGSSDKKSKKKDKKEKGGFLAKLSKILFGEDDEETEEGKEQKSLTPEGDEASQILKELEEAEEAGKGSGGKKEKGKKKKEKKAKKPKKEKKPKTPKPKKEKKPKKPKEVDLSPPLPKAPVILIFVMAVSAMLFVILSSNLLGYSVDMTEAKSAYASGDYVKAYQTVAGLNAKKDDEEFYQQALLLARIQSEINSGDGLYDLGKYRMALDSYICALGRYDSNYGKAAEYEVQSEYDELKKRAAGKLEARFGVSEEQARELYGLRSRKEYTCSIYDIIKELGMAEE